VDGLTALLESGADPNRQTARGIAPLHIVHSATAAAVLIAHGANINIADAAGATPFSAASTRSLADYFLASGADVNAVENWRNFVRQGTALHKAVYQQDTERTYWLLRHGADPNRGDINGFSPLFYAIWRRDYTLI